MKKIILCILYSVSVAVCTPVFAQMGMTELGDSLTAYTGYSPLWASPVKVKNLRVNRNNVTVRTNHVFKDVRWTMARVSEIKRKVSLWVLGNTKGKVTIIAGKTPIDELVTDCSRGIMANGKYHDLTERTIALYPSHGLYFNRSRNEWIWQRATLWTTVEDVYSQEYVRLIRRMLENAGANVISPRPGLEHTEPGLSGMPQWTECARSWLQVQGADSTLWDLYEGDEYKDDMKCRAMWVNAQEEPIDLCVALHTDGMDSGDDSTTVGTLVIYTAYDDDGNAQLRDKRDRMKVNRNLADWIQTQVTSDLRHWNPEWTRRQLREANYCESRVPVVPSLILELLSHKNMADMQYGLDPKFRFAAARAVYKGILRGLNGKSAVVQPMPVKDLGIQITNDQSQMTNALLQWKPVTDSLEQSADPTYYMVYIQQDGGEWNVQQVEKKTELAVEMQPGVAYNFYVVAGNDGGLSFPSPIVSAYINDSEAVLIVDAFDDAYGPEWFADSTFAGIVPGSYACEDYMSCAYIGEQWDFRRSSLWTDDDNCGWGACYRDHAGQFTVGNTHDYAAQHGRVLRRMNISYISCTAGYLSGEADLSVKRSVSETVCQAQPVLIDFICGRQRNPLTADGRKLIADYLSTGGRLLLSSDHISAIDPAWLDSTLHVRFHASHATRSGHISLHTAVVGPTSDRQSRSYYIHMRPNEKQLFSPAPQGLMPTDTTALRYATYDDMRCPAAVSTPTTLIFGFPLEASLDFPRLYRHAIEWLLKKDTEIISTGQNEGN